MYRKLILNENIPPDLAKEYHQTDRAYGSIGNSTFDPHRVFTSGERRNTQLDFHKAIYKEITKEEAYSIIHTSPNDIKKLRILVNSNLYIYDCTSKNAENPDNLLPVCAPSSVFYVKGKTEKATLSTMINKADKIYWTDEYDHKLSDDIKKERDEKRKIDVICTYDSAKLSSDDLEHKPYLPRYRGRQLVQKVFDTGNHGNISRDSADTDYTDINNIPSYFNPYRTVASFANTGNYKKYYYALTQKREAYKKLNAARKQLKALEKDLKENPDIDRNEELEKLKQNVQDCYDANYEAAQLVRKEKDHVIQWVDSETLKVNYILNKTAFNIDLALNASYTLKRRLEYLKNIDYKDDVLQNNNGSRFTSPAKMFNHLVVELEKKKNKLATLQKKCKSKEKLEQKIPELMQQLKDINNELQSIIDKKLINYFKQVYEIEEYMTKFEKARKNLGRNKNNNTEPVEKEISKEVMNFIKFVN